ncbi:preprotein translocase subunit SecA [Candidatus Parcubacteria bacterium]|nr:MAG: preprotein translocase subunit SecA [Candidatus Parcubacteria bacterium]
MLNTLKKFFHNRSLRSLRDAVMQINSLEPEIGKLNGEELKLEGGKLRSAVQGGTPLDEVLPRAFALVREAARRTLKQRPFDVQLMGGIVLHRGAVAEMMTGEGKTLAAVAPAYLNALSGKGVHVVTVNEYLARRDVAWMGQIYQALGLSVTCLVPSNAFLYDPDWKIPEEGKELIDRERDATGNFLVQQELLRPVSRREAYQADITYGTNHEFGFDYLRDNLVYGVTEQVQREHHYAIVDEVDSILIDEARTPLIIAAPDSQSSDFYKTFARVVARLEDKRDYAVDEKKRSVHLTEEGIERVEKTIGVQNIYAPEHLRLVHYLEESLRAKALYRKDRDYVVREGEIVIVDEFTGRLLFGRRYNGGLHQAIEAKEGVFVKEESRTYAKISIQNYFRMYKKISGMTGTAATSAEEFHKVYGLDVVSVPPNKPLIREDKPDLIYKNARARWEEAVKEIQQIHKAGRPILVGTTSIEKNELLSTMLTKAGVSHEVLNAKNNEREGAIIAQAGRPGAVTVATNVAGRGVDIILGGNPPDAEEARKVRELGGLYVVGTERHEARRIDNQLRGRSGRQGDTGTSRFFLSLEDDLLRIFGGDRIKGLMDRFNLPDDQPIEMGFVSKAVGEAQAKVEGANFDLRKHLLEYDDVLNKQRMAVYRRRREFLGTLSKADLAQTIFGSAKAAAGRMLAQPAPEGEDVFSLAKRAFEETGILTGSHKWPEEPSEEALVEILEKRSGEVAELPQALPQMLSILDLLWMNHLEDLEALSESVGLRAYGQKDPLVEYKNEASRLFKSFWVNFDGWVFANMFRLSAEHTRNSAERTRNVPVAVGSSSASSQRDKVGRNDPCPCGEVNPATGQVYKYKKCGLINAPHHKK